MQHKQNDYVKNIEDNHIKDSKTTKPLSLQEQLALFAEILIDIYFKTETKINQDEKG